MLREAGAPAARRSGLKFPTSARAKQITATDRISKTTAVRRAKFMIE
jgi:hypothetical protein